MNGHVIQDVTWLLTDSDVPGWVYYSNNGKFGLQDVGLLINMFIVFMECVC